MPLMNSPLQMLVPLLLSNNHFFAHIALELFVSPTSQPASAPNDADCCSQNAWFTFTSGRVPSSKCSTTFSTGLCTTSSHRSNWLVSTWIKCLTRLTNRFRIQVICLDSRRVRSLPLCVLLRVFLHAVQRVLHVLVVLIEL